MTAVTQPRINKNTLLAYTHTLRPNLLNDFRIGYHRIDFDTLNHFDVERPSDAGPSLGIPGFDGDTGYSNPGIPSINVSNFSGLVAAARTGPVRHDVPVSNVLAYNRGSHNIRAGFDLRRMATGRRAANDPRGLLRLQRRHQRLLRRRLHARAAAHGHPAHGSDPGPRGRLAQRLLRQR